MSDKTQGLTVLLRAYQMVMTGIVSQRAVVMLEMFKREGGGNGFRYVIDIYIGEQIIASGAGADVDSAADGILERIRANGAAG